MTAAWPAILRSLRGAAVTAAVLPVIALVVLAVGSGSQQHVATTFFINLTVLMGLQIFMGNSGVTNFGHIAFMGIGAYVASILLIPPGLKATIIPDAPFGLVDVELAFIPAVLVAIAITAIVAFVSGIGVARQVGIAAAIVTLALLVIVHTVLLNWDELTRGARALYGIPGKTTLISAMLVAAGSVVIARLFRDSPVGLQLRAGADDPLAAASMGVDIRRLRLFAWILGSVIAGIGGIVYALDLQTISPNSFYFQATFLTLAMLLLGGMRSVSGAVVGAIVVTVGLEFVRNLEDGASIGPLELPTMRGLTEFFLGAIIILVMALRRDGLVGDDELDETLVGKFRRLRKRRVDRRLGTSNASDPVR
jgi:branched-chain amino acid transport system permease protein